MRKYIDAEETKQTFCAECNHTLKCEDCDIDFHFRYATAADVQEAFKAIHDAPVIILPAADVAEVVRCCKCIYWDRDTIRHQGNDFRDWNEAECLVLAERDGYNEINRYTEADDFCSKGERKDG